ncbi:AAA family ATPase [Rhizobium sp. G187]|uniref:bifunctional aminoglycoside phosphotransferase/ATP-binding protein n=1 Tax=Rhizobium sp. G187 TaxID=3451352 RepID=UPI003EE7FAB5
MQFDDQSATIAFLSDPASYTDAEDVQVIETHISIIALAGDRAYKLKRAVKLPYADFSTLALRLKYCRAEVELNGRTAPEIYLGVRSVIRSKDGTLAFAADDADADVIDYVVEMSRFSQAKLFDRLAEQGQLSKPLMEETAERIADFHSSAEIRHEGSGSANLGAVLDINEAAFASANIFPARRIASLNAAFRAAWSAESDRLDRREMEDAVRLCHGDLHLRNLFLGPHGPRMFDCIDFNEKLAVSDVLYDLAFLLMDLWHRDLPDFANIVVNRYLDRMNDEGGFAALPLFMAVRAAIRAHVSATRISQANDQTVALLTEAEAYVDLAERLLRPQTSILIAIGGLSGSGKSTLAEALAPRLGQAPGARLLESDRIRRSFLALPRGVKMPPEAYLPDMSARVYQSLFDKAQIIVSSGACAVVNAVFDREGDRRAIEDVAKRNAVPFVGLWLDVDTQVLRERLEARPKLDSDATVEILDMQMRRDLGPLDWTHVRNDATPAELLARVLTMVPASIRLNGY